MINEADNALRTAFQIPAALLDSFAGLLAPDSRFFPPYILITVIIAAAAYYINRHALSEKHRSGLFSYLFDPDAYIQPSSLVDLKIALANRLFTPVLLLAGKAAIIISAAATASLLLGDEATGASVPASEIGFMTLVFATIAITVASDFTTYWVHRVHHESAVLWPFHKLHHSAETLTPLTFTRKHPLYDLFRALSNAAIVGPAQGVLFAAFGIVDVGVILGVNAVYAVFHWTGSNLRHSHVWLSYGPIMSRILISPAQHQIHHSCAVKHHNKNYGEIFAFWDWAFGTLYVPQGYEKLQFGVADDRGVRIEQPHPTLRKAWIVPFQESAAAFYEHNSSDEKSPSTSI